MSLGYARPAAYTLRASVIRHGSREVPNPGRIQKPVRFNQRASWRALVRRPSARWSRTSARRRIVGSGHECLPWPSAFSMSPIKAAGPRPPDRDPNTALSSSSAVATALSGMTISVRAVDSDSVGLGARLEADAAAGSLVAAGVCGELDTARV